MSRNFIHSIKSLCFLFLFYRLSARTVRSVPESPTRTKTSQPSHVSNATWHDFSHLLNVQKGSHVSGVSDVKRYLYRFGYGDIDSKNISDVFDGHLESAISLYQKNLGLRITGKLDSNTVSLMSSPRCGISDAHMSNGINATMHYTYLGGKWNRTTPFTLTYAFSKTHKLNYVTPDDMKAVFRRAFAHWSTVIPLIFQEIDDMWTSDLKIAFYSGNHGDGQSFDGALGILAHSTGPGNGNVHFDSAERWNVDEHGFSTESTAVIDLESVAIHEIGHLLGLGHSSEVSAIMYPSISARTKKVELSPDDVAGIVKLYGEKPQNPKPPLNDSPKKTAPYQIDSFWGILQVLFYWFFSCFSYFYRKRFS